MPKISEQQMVVVFQSGGSFNPVYKETKELHEDLNIHFEGKFPEKLLKERRPSEPEEIQKYRRATYQPITVSPISKVVTSLGKIRRSQDFVIKFPENLPARITKEDSPKRYFTEKLPGFNSIESWAFDVLLPQNLIDANAVVAVIPIDAVPDNELPNPVPIIFNSEQVLFFSEREGYALLKGKAKTTYVNPDGSFTSGDTFYYIDDEVVLIFAGTEFKKISEIKNACKKFPVFKVRAEVYKPFDNIVINRSRINAMLPYLNKAAVNDNDLDGSKVQHLYPTMWVLSDKDCPECGGLGKKAGEGEKKCSACDGGGKVKFSPYTIIEVSTPDIGKSAIPFKQPAGFIQKDTEILKLQDETVDKNIYNSLCSINMQFLDQTPLAISGDAKNVDREELNNFVYNVAEDIIYAISRVLYYGTEWRYSYYVQEESKRIEMIPNISVPMNFDLLPSEYLMKEVADARTNKVNPLLIATLEQQMAAKKFYNQPELANNIALFFELDPLPGLSVDEKFTLNSTGAITKEDLVISCYMASFVKRAIRENKEFIKKTYDEQYSVLQKYAKAKMASVDEAAKLMEERRKKMETFEPPVE